MPSSTGKNQRSSLPGTNPSGENLRTLGPAFHNVFKGTVFSRYYAAILIETANIWLAAMPEPLTKP